MLSANKAPDAYQLNPSIPTNPVLHPNTCVTAVCCKYMLCTVTLSSQHQYAFASLGNAEMANLLQLLQEAELGVVIQAIDNYLHVWQSPLTCSIL